MRLKHLEAALSSIQRDFPSPNVALEQYPTSAHLAACVIQCAIDHGDLEGGESHSDGNDASITCLDLGCGTGMLSVAAAFASSLVISIDCDQDAMQVAQENVDLVDLEETVVFLQAQVQMKHSSDDKSNVPQKMKHAQKGRGRGGGRKQGGRGRGRGRIDSSSFVGGDTLARIITNGQDGIPLQDNCVDTVLTNPPFGTKNNAGIDVQFLRTACRLARVAVYSFHKRSTRSFLLKTLDDWGYDAKVVAEMAFDVPQMYKFHSQKSKDIEVDLIRVSVLEHGDVIAESHETEDETDL